jgi:hypothetical protein
MSSAPEDLTNLINLQHPIMGALGLFGGLARLLALRGLVRTPPRAVCVAGLHYRGRPVHGVFYREVV